MKIPIKFVFVFEDVRACEDHPCRNNGTCVVYLRSYLCQCQTGFTGRSCEIGRYSRGSIDGVLTFALTRSNHERPWSYM
jgi:hypothetical protein